MIALPNRHLRLIPSAAGLLCLVLVGTGRADSPPADLPAAAEQTVNFRRDVFPILSARCFKCHQGREASSGIRLDDRREILGETTGNPLVTPGESRNSKLIRLVASTEEDRRMPPEGERLSREEIGVLRAWIVQSLSWDESLLPPVLRETDHWAFQPVRRPPIPRVSTSAEGNQQTAGWIHNPVDAFIAAGHREHGLKPAPQADKRTLIRRLYLDMLGIPPSTVDVERFLADDSPSAWKQLVDEVLASPRYGERWGRHWLDVARWSETEGYESNHPRPFAWRYRDYVVESFNGDKPYDEFIRQQVAGDELVPYSDENLIATGFLAAARISSNEEDKWLQRNDTLVDVVNATGSAFLGLTVNCAQCHNHKFDPITIRDYYSLQGFFVQGQPVNVTLRGDELRREYEARRPPDYEPARVLKRAIFEAARQRYIEAARREMTPEMLRAVDTPLDERTIEQELIARRATLKYQATPNRIEKHIPEEDRKLYAELEKKIAEIEKQVVEPQTFAFYSPVTSPHEMEVLPSVGFYPLPYKPEELARAQPYIQVRGDVHNIGPEISPGWPDVFETVFDFPAGEDKPLTRTALAEWITHPRNPLTARVWVNRIWHYHFGRGIVPSPGDFGARTEKPPHAELLDWLAAELIDSGWSTKHIQRLILNSATYRLASTVDPRNTEIDPDNVYLWHWAPQRLEVEVIRDSMLAVSSELQQSLGGPSVPLDEADLATRRSLYLFQKRGLPPEMQKLFDGPSEASESCARRHTSTTPLQSLYLLNDAFTLARAQTLAAEIQKSAGGDLSRQIETAFRRILGRNPAADELQASEDFFATHRVTVSTEAHDQKQAPAPLVQFCQALLNLNEFVYIE